MTKSVNTDIRSVTVKDFYEFKRKKGCNKELKYY